MKKAFTLAEVLITLTIIGIIAAMVIPSLMADINEKAFDTQRKALYARFSQAIPAMDKIAGYGTLTGTLSSGNTQQNVITDTAAETFVTEGLSKVIKMNNTCYSDNITECNFPESITTMNGTTINLSSILTLKDFNPLMMSTTGDLGKYEQLNTKAAAFETANGESVLVYYNPNCQPDLKETTIHYSQPKMCANFVYDLNGAKAPNSVGKDVGFITIMYSTNPAVLAPMPLATNASADRIKQTEALVACKAQDSESRLPNKDEATSLFYNMRLIDIPSGAHWSSSVYSPGASGMAWNQNSRDGHRDPWGKTNAGYVRCVKK